MKDAAAPLLEPAPKRSVFDNLRKRVFLLVEGQTQAGRVFLTISFTLSLLSFVIFALQHEPGYEEYKELYISLQNLTVVFFSFEYVLRVWTCVELLPDIERLHAGAIIAARLCWACTNFFAIIDLVSLVPYYYARHHAGTIMNTQWLRVIRILRVLPSLPYGQLWSKSAPLLFAGGFAGFTIWLICACLYYMFERENPLMDYSPAGDDAGPKDPHWNNFHSIPAAMYFSLLNFFGEFPLIDQHSTGGRFVAMFIQVLGAAVMAIPAGALGNAFGDIVDGDDDDDDDGDDNKEDDKQDDDKDDDDEQPVLQASSDEVIQCLDGQTDVKVLPYTDDIGGVDAGSFCFALTIFLSVGSTLHFVLDSLTKFPGNLETLVSCLDILKSLAGYVFLVEWIYRLKLALRFGELYSYQCSTLGLVDLLAVAPLLRFFFPSSTLVEASTVLRILKLERFVGAFRSFWSIICQSATAFTVTGTVALVSWLVFSTLMYFAERHNPDEDMQRYYSSVFTSMWITLLNLSGEVPLCQYTVTGKVIVAIMGLFGVGFVSIPMGLLGDGFQDKVDDADGDEDEDNKKEEADVDAQAEELVGAAPVDFDSMTKRQKVFKFLQGAADNQSDDINPWEGRAVRFEQFVILMIFVSAVVATLEADGVSDKVDDNAWYQSAFEAFVIALFTVEYGMRYYAAPEDPKLKKKGYVSDSACRFAFASSWSSIVDICAILPFYASLCGSSLADQYDGQMRMLRVFRLLTLDKYIPSVSLIGRVMTNSAEQFKMAGYAMVSLWLIFATLLWLTERNDKFQVDDLTQSQRYHDVIRALPYTLIHLTGDYPLVDYTIQAKIILFFALLFAVGVVSVPAGLLAAGFMRELRIYHAAQKKAQEKSMNVIQKYVRKWVARRRLLKRIRAAVIEARDLAAQERKLKNEMNLQFRVFNFLEGNTSAGQKWAKFMMFLIAANVASVIGESVPWIQAFFGQTFLDSFEFFSVLIFTTTYIANIWVAPMNRKFQLKRENYIFSFWGVVDFITVAPYWLQLLVELLATVGMPGSAFIAQHAFIFRVVRVLRILQAEDYVESFTLLDDAWRESRDSMIACGFMAMMVWVLGSVLFYNFEQGNPRMSGAFDTLISSMYYSMIFLGGEWGLVDFTPAGQIVCVFYCVIGIALYGIPVGALFDAFSTVLEDKNSQKAEDE